LVLLVVSTSVVILFLYYNSLKNEKASLIQLASFHPYDEFIFGHSEKVFANFADPNDAFGFFQYHAEYERLSGAINGCQEAEDKLKGFLPVNLDSVIWVTKTLSPIEFYIQKVTIPHEDLVYLQNSMTKYVDAFEEVLEQNHWKASLSIPEVQHEDSIHLDTHTVEIALKQFQDKFIRKDFILLNTKDFDPSNLTLFELSTALEQIKWHRYEIENEYMTIVFTRRQQWREVLADKIKIVK
jgi:hypothetical protein